MKDQQDKKPDRKLTCLRCGWTWVPRIEGRPKCCNGCKSPRWDEPRREPK